MNAEFLEQKIVLTTKTVEGETITTITPAKVRKGLDTNAFIGAMVCGPNYSSLVIHAFADQSNNKISLKTGRGDGEPVIQYDPTTGDIALAEEEVVVDPGTT